MNFANAEPVVVKVESCFFPDQITGRTAEPRIPGVMVIVAVGGQPRFHFVSAIPRARELAAAIRDACDRAEAEAVRK